MLTEWTGSGEREGPGIWSFYEWIIGGFMGTSKEEAARFENV